MSEKNSIKFTICNADKKEQKFEAQYNPSETSLSLTNNWEPIADGEEGQSVKFISSGVGDFSITLIVDGYDKIGNPKWVAEEIEKLMVLARPGDNTPPKVLMVWGWGSDCQKYGVIKSITVDHKLFDPIGNPIRSSVAISFMEVKENAKVARSNKTSSAQAGK